MPNYYTLRNLNSSWCSEVDFHCSFRCEHCKIGEYPNFLGYLKQLIELKVFSEKDADEKKASGITRQVINKGLKSLSPQQAFVFEKEVLEPYTVKRCSRTCEAGRISWDDMYDVVVGESRCSYCQSRLDEMDKDDYSEDEW